MKVSELFEVIAKGAVSLRGKTHKGCGGKFDETTQMDDMDGVLHCTKCNKEVQSRVQPEELKKLTESLNEGYAIKLKSGSWYSEERPTLGPVKGGNSQVRVFKSMSAADDFLIMQQNSKFGGKKFEDAEIKRAPKAVKEDCSKALEDAILYNWMSLSNDEIVTKVKSLAMKGDKKFAELRGKSGAELLDMVEDAKDNVKNQIDEAKAGKGMWVIKNKDGVEKRFKDDASPEAKAWKESNSKKRAPAVKAEKFSQAWWEAKEDAADRYGDVLTPWTRIELGMGNGDLSTAALEAMGEYQGFGNVDDFHKLGTGETKVDDVHCATIRLRVVAVYTKDDDLGIEGDEPVSDSYNIMVRRDIKDPKKFVFMRFM